MRKFSFINWIALLGIFVPLIVNRSVYLVPPVLGYLPALILVILLKDKKIDMLKLLLGLFCIFLMILTPNFFDYSKSINVVIVYTLFFLILSGERIVFGNLEIQALKWLAALIFSIGLLQVFDFIDLNTRDKFYFSNLLPFQFNRMTSIFIEPSACGIFFVIVIYLYEKLSGKNFVLGYLGVFLTFSTQALVVLILLKLARIFLTQNKSQNLIVPVLIFIITFPVVSSQIKERFYGDNFGHRVSGPTIAINQIQNEFKFSEILFGKGIGSLGNITHLFSENAATTHNAYVDIVYEAGTLALFMLVITIFVIIGVHNAIILSIFLLAVGYRSPDLIGLSVILRLKQSTV